MAGGSASLFTGAFQVNKASNAAARQATVQAYAFLTQNCWPLLPVELNLTWTGTGALAHNRSVAHANAASCHSTSRLLGDYRDAVATGRVTAVGLHCTPDPAASAQLAAVQQGAAQSNCS